MRLKALVRMGLMLLAATYAAELHAQTFITPFPDADNPVFTIGVLNSTTMYVAGPFDNLVRRDGVGQTNNQTSGALNTSLQYGSKVFTSIPDGTGGYFVGGNFTWVGSTVRTFLCHITAAGALDAGFTPPTFNGDVRSLLLVGGRLYVGGEFTTADGATHNRIARVTPATGALDASFTISVTGTPGSGHQVSVLAMDCAADGSAVFIGGFFDAVGGFSRDNMARINISGTGVATLDGTFTGGTDAAVWAVRVVSTSKLIIGGEFEQLTASARSHIAKIEASSGAGVAGWNPGANSTVFDIKVTGTSVMVCGSFSTIGSKTRNKMAKLSISTGAVGTGFVIGGAVTNTIHSITDDGNGKWYCAGSFQVFDGVTRNFLAKVDASGNVDGTWNPGSALWTEMWTVSFDAGHVGNGVFSGGRQDFSFADAHLGKVVSNVARFSEAQSSTPPWASGFAFRNVSGTDRILAVGPSATFFIFNGGNRTDFGEWDLGATNMSATQFRPTSGTGGTFKDIAMTGSTSAIVVGSFTNVEIFDGSNWGSATARNNIVEVNFATSPITFTALDPNANGGVTTVTVSGTTAYVAGSFTQIGGLNRAGLAAIDLTTGNVTAWDPSPNGTVNSIAVDASGNVYLGGSFTALNGTTRNRIACVDNNTGAVTAWNPGADATVNVVLVVNNTIYAGGAFTQIGGTNINFAAALSRSTAAVDGAWNPNPDAWINDMAVYNGNLVLAGNFNVILSRNVRGLGAVSLSTAFPKMRNEDPAAGTTMAGASLEARPNPTRGTATIEFSAPDDAKAEVRLYSAVGSEVRRLFEGDVTAGAVNTVTLERGDLAPGVYLVRLVIGKEQLTRRIVIVD